MALKNDTFFALSKGERRATLLLVIILIILMGARVILYYLPSNAPQATTEYDSFKTQLEEFEQSLSDKEAKKGKNGQDAVKNNRPPKSLKPVPREE